MIRRIVLMCVAVALALPALGQTTVNGAGATFPNPMYQKWFSEYHKAHPDVQFNYQSIGSGGGIRQVLAQTVDFGASDGPMTDEQLSQAKTKILHIPTVLGAVVPAYNVPGVSTELKFTPEALSGIFLGKITTWNDPAIAKANPGVTLPNQTIIVIHRSDGSGTTYIFTDYSMKNASGAFVKASLDSVTAAAASAKSMPADFRVSITNAPGKDAYPISSFTWLLIPEKSKEAAKGKILADFLNWMVDDGQKMTAELTYAPLPENVAVKVKGAIKQVQ